MGFSGKEIAAVLNVTPAAITQYLKGRRGGKLDSNNDTIIRALVDKAAQRIRSGGGPLRSAELLDVAYQLMSANKGRQVLEGQDQQKIGNESIGILKQRLQVELKAAEKCLELANRTRDDYAKLLLRMIASDSIRHADIVSQLISWSAAPGGPDFEPPDREVLNEMLAIEDKASESSLSQHVKIPNLGAMLLLESIDMDEEKHDKIVEQMLKHMPRPKTSVRR
jgi:predicted transcriptional regulator